MKISDLIKQLQETMVKSGDIEVVVNGNDFTTNAIYLDITPYYYDGGVTLKDPSFKGKYHCNRWLKSRKHPELGDRYLHIRCDEPCMVDGNEYIEETLIPEISTEEPDWDKDLDKKVEQNFDLYRKA